MNAEACDAAPLRARICHFGPETPALSQTFVYREALALKRRGHFVLSVSVRRPAAPAREDLEALGDVEILYDGDVGAFIAAFADGLAARPLAAAESFLMLISDLAASAGEGRFSPALIAHWLAGFRLAQLLRRRRIEHLHAHFAHVPTQIAMYASKIAGVPFSATAHANDIFERGLLLARKARRSFRIAAISHYNFEALAAAGADPKKLCVIRCAAPHVGAATARPRQAGATLRIGSLGRLVEKKGMATAIDAAAILKARGKDVRLEIVGDGPLGDALQSRIEALGVGDNVRLLGAMANDRALDWMRGLDVLAMACQTDSNGDQDGVPVAIMEAMALQVPVVSTRLSGIPELVVDGVSGLLCEPENASCLADAIERIAGDPSLRAALVAGADAQIAGEFSEAVNIARLENLIAEATGRAP